MNKLYFKTFSTCTFVKGANRSLICNLQKNSYFFIPNDLFEIIELHDGKTVNEIKKHYNNQFDLTIDEYVNFLLDKKVAFYTKTPNLFPSLSLQWNHSSIITNAIVEDLDFNELSKILIQLDKLNCKHIEFRFFKKFQLSKINKLIYFIENEKKIFNSIDFVFNDSENIDIISFKESLLNNPRISSVIIGNSKTNGFEIINENLKSFIYYCKENIDSNKHCGKISLGNFITNIKLFTESQHHNTCLNKKISIDKDGYIKNCPSMTQSFGNINNTTLEEAINHPDFKKYWNISKDQIDVCKDCEFRHICTDCRAYTERITFNGDIDLSKPLKCGYNPYTNEWSEWSTNPLKEKAIEFYSMPDLIKKDA